MEDKGCHHCGWRMGTFTRRVALSGGLNPDAIKATHKDSVFELTVAKPAAPSKSRNQPRYLSSHERREAMPPHCDAMDGPVVKAARSALAAGDVGLVLPYVHEAAEDELRVAFQRVLPLTRDRAAAKEVSELYFFETAVRLHRAGEGASFTGLKPAGLDVGPVIPVAERAIEEETPDELAQLLSQITKNEVETRFRRVMNLKRTSAEGISEAREYVSAALGLQVWAHGVYKSVIAHAHSHGIQGQNG